MMTATRVENIPPISRAEVEDLAREEYARVARQLRSLSPEDWTTPTDCGLWDVRAVAGHTTGMLATFTGYGPLMRTMRAAGAQAKKSGVALVDALTAKQVADHAHLTTDELVAKIDAVGPKAAHWRATRPSLLRALPMKQDVAGKTEIWRMGYLFHLILTRDPWMHRVDVSRATGKEMELTPDHDGRLVADVVAEWARRHGQPFTLTLTLTGPAGGHYVGGDGSGEEITIDAVEFCRILSGRATGTGLLAQEVPF